jgi:hypothetical protein
VRAEHLFDDNLLVLESLVILKKPLNLTKHVRRQLALVGVIGKGRIVDTDRHDLVVDPLLVPHAHDADSPRIDEGQWVNRFLAEHEYVKGIPVITVRPRNEPVVRRIVHRAEQDAVEPKEAGLFFQLAFVLAALRTSIATGKASSTDFSSR